MLREKHTQPFSPQTALENRLAATRQAFEEFAYMVAHDLNAPLRCIVSFSQILENKYRTVLDDKGTHYIDLITENSRKAQHRLAGLLQYSRLDTVPLQLENVDCNEVLDHVLKQLRNEIHERGAMLRIRTLPHIVADREKLSLLFYCLISNALKFCALRPEIDIDANRSHDAWVFSVRDNGIGIAPKFHDTIFGVFQRLHGDEEYDGIGMGLAHARRITELHDGIIWLESEPDAGTVFYFTIADPVAAG